MSSRAKLSSRPATETLLLVAVAVCLGIAVVRFAVMAVSAGGVVYAGTAGSSSPSETVAADIVKSAAWRSWWGGRDVPFREGGDYLGVMSYSLPTRTIGAVIGVVVERDRASGVAIDRVLVPVDEEALFGRPPGAIFTRPDGTTYRSMWAPLGVYTKYFTDVPVEQSAYDPALTADAFAELAARTRITERSRDFFTAAPVPGGSGTWMLYSRKGTPRVYLLVPRESIQAGGAS